MRHVTAIVVVGFLVCPSDVQAEEQDVQALFQQGIERYQTGRHEEALALFETAYSIRSDPAILYNIATCQRDLDRIPDSVNSFRLYLQEEDPSRISAEDHAEIQRLLQEMRPRHGDIEIRVDVDGATVLVDGVEVGVSPLGQPVAVSPGEHRVSARLEGRTPAERSGAVRGGETITFALNLEAVAAGPTPGPEPEPASVPEPVPERQPATSPPSHEGGRLAGPWALLGSGLGMLLVGGILDVVAYVRSDPSTFDQLGSYAEYDDWATSSTNLAIAGDVLVFLGAAVAVGGLVWLLVARSRRWWSRQAVAPALFVTACPAGHSADVMLRF
jgi:hypothetical protein